MNHFLGFWCHLMTSFQSTKGFNLTRLDFLKRATKCRQCFLWMAASKSRLNLLNFGVASSTHFSFSNPHSGASAGGAPFIHKMVALGYSWNFIWVMLIFASILNIPLLSKWRSPTQQNNNKRNHRTKEQSAKFAFYLIAINFWGFIWREPPTCNRNFMQQMALSLYEIFLQDVMVVVFIKSSPRWRTVRTKIYLLKTPRFGTRTRIISTPTTEMHSQHVRLLHCSCSFSSHLQIVPSILGGSLD